jgi:hypothetical protein
MVQPKIGIEKEISRHSAVEAMDTSVRWVHHVSDIQKTNCFPLFKRAIS